MKLLQWVKVGVLAIVITGLAGCSNHKQSANSFDGPSAMNGPGPAGGGGGAPGAESYAMQGQRAYQGQAQKGSDGEIINPMGAPASQTYYFGYNQSIVRPQDDKAILVQANYLSTHPNARIRLEGNTDNRGSREYNVGLGWRRDQAIARLFEQEGVAPNQIKMLSYGKEHPVIIGNTEGAWKLNRRVHLVYEAY